jgi:hypothetical protein
MTHGFYIVSETESRFIGIKKIKILCQTPGNLIFYRTGLEFRVGFDGSPLSRGQVLGILYDVIAAKSQC